MSVVPSVYEMAQYYSIYPSYFRERQKNMKVNPIFAASYLSKKTKAEQKQHYKNIERKAISQITNKRLQNRYIISFYSGLFLYRVRTSNNLNDLFNYTSAQTLIPVLHLNNAFNNLARGNYKERLRGARGFLFTIKLIVNW